jgi:hypothetical protein
MDFDVHIRVAGTEGRTLSGIQKSIHFQMIAPGQKQDNDSSQENKVLPRLC